VALLRGAIEYAKKRGARILEGYPVAPKTPRMPDVFAWTGLAGAFRKAGFKEVARRSPTRPIVRFSISRAV
ncbi:MAG: GNAT family N-acetyltransferase, partial [Deltaproteobacteria bacterium]